MSTRIVQKQRPAKRLQVRVQRTSNRINPSYSGLMWGQANWPVGTADTAADVTSSVWPPLRVAPGSESLAILKANPDHGDGKLRFRSTTEIQTLTKGTSVTAGTFDLNVLGMDITGIAYNVTAAALQTLVRAAVKESTDPWYKALGSTITVTGGPINSTAFTITYPNSGNVPQAVSDDTDLTGTIVDATSQAGVSAPNFAATEFVRLEDGTTANYDTAAWQAGAHA